MRIVGYLDMETARESASAILALYSGQTREIYLEASEMQGYRRGARVLWQERLSQMRGRIPRIVLVEGNSVVRMSTSVIAMALGVPLFTKTSDEESPGEDAPIRRKRPRSASRPIARPTSKIATRRTRGHPQRDDARPVPVRRKREKSRPV